MSAVLDEAWTELRKIQADIPPAVILVLSAREHRRRGHFSMEAWQRRSDREMLHEVAVHPGMFESPEDLLVTMVHEAAHAILWEQRRDSDRHCCGVSIRGYYHRLEFRSAAEKLGLEVGFLNRRYGFTLTDWPASGAPVQYHHVLEILGSLQVIASHQLPARHRPPARAKVSPRWETLGCECYPIRKLRAPQNELQRGSIVCGICNMPFLSFR